jgi:hypothetical protein
VLSLPISLLLNEILSHQKLNIEGGFQVSVVELVSHSVIVVFLYFPSIDIKVSVVLLPTVSLVVFPLTFSVIPSTSIADSFLLVSIVLVVVTILSSVISLYVLGSLGFVHGVSS